MRLYDCKPAISPRRVRIFLAEKGIEIPTVQVDLMKGEHKQPEYRKIAPNGLVPALVLDDGTVLVETVAICRYFEGRQPDPPLMGIDSTDTAIVEMWQRRMEFELMLPMAMVFRHTHPAMAVLQEQFPDFGNGQRKVVEKRLDRLDKELSDREFIAGERYTIADITAQASLDFFGKLAKFDIGDQRPNLKRWHEAVSARPSAAA